MRGVPEVSTDEALLERGDELEQIRAAVDSAGRGSGSVVAIEGGAGTGKSSLLRAAVHHAEATGAGVLHARGSELEGEFGFGVLRQLFEWPLHAVSDARRERIMRGAAGLAAPALGLAPAAPGESMFAPLHGTYWLLAELAEDSPLLVVVDDAHWSDLESLRCIGYMANRIADMPVALLVALRPLADRSPRAHVTGFTRAGGLLELSPLGVESVAELVRMRLDSEPDPDFTAACHRATGGNPLAVTEVLRELDAAGAEPSAAVAATLEDRPPPRLARGIVARVKSAGRAPERFARALAVLGDEAEPVLVADLAELDPDAAARAADTLIEAETLAPGRPLRFLHPLIRSAVYEGIAPGARSRAHRRAAELLSGRPDGTAAAIHLLSVDPAGDAEVVDRLMAAAELAGGSGAPEAASSYLDRALREPPPADRRVQILRHLGLSQVATGRIEGLEHLKAARAESTEAVERAEVAAELSGVMAYTGDWRGAIEIAHETLAELGDTDHPVAFTVEASVAALEWNEAEYAGSFTESLPRRLALAESSNPAARALALILSGALAGRGETEAALELARRGLDCGAFVRETPPDRLEAAQGLNALVWSERTDEAVRAATDLVEAAGRRGSVFGLIAGSILRGTARLRRGELDEAEADLLVADRLVAEHDAFAVAPFATASLVLVMVERGRAGEALERVERLPDGLVTSALVTLQHVRGVVRLNAGDREGGLADLRETGELMARLGTLSPGVAPWRAQLAEALAESDPAEARSLADEELRRAREAGLPAAEGVALRALALPAPDGDERIALLEQAVAALEPTDARLEHARALTDLGAAMTAAGRGEGARPLLLTALDMAHRCGAWLLAERARAEAVAAGARPRRPYLTGVQALTPSELRVARLAADGHSNKEIAQSLFVTKKTVADHLRASYRKLGLSRRDELPGALQARS